MLNHDVNKHEIYQYKNLNEKIFQDNQQMCRSNTSN